MTTLYLVRHGQTDWNLQTRYQGHSDIPLNETGLQQAAQAVETLNGTGYRALYASDLQRAQQTAAFFAAKTGLTIQTDSRLREINMGDWEGQCIADIRAANADFVRIRDAQPTVYAPPQGETVLDVARRVVACVDEICQAYPDDAVLVVAHGMSMATLYCLAMDIDLNLVFQHIFKNAEIRPVTWFPGRAELES